MRKLDVRKKGFFIVFLSKSVEAFFSSAPFFCITKSRFVPISFFKRMKISLSFMDESSKQSKRIDIFFEYFQNICIYFFQQRANALLGKGSFRIRSNSAFDMQETRVSHVLLFFFAKELLFATKPP